MSLFRVYEVVGSDGYPPEWHETIKHLVREQAGHRCIRCRHPYLVGKHAMEIDHYTDDERPVYASWSPCDKQCVHGGPTRERQPGYPAAMYMGPITEARARILTVHHLTGVKADCRWWNLVSLCQRCHLRVLVALLAFAADARHNDDALRARRARRATFKPVRVRPRPGFLIGWISAQEYDDRFDRRAEWPPVRARRDQWGS